MAKKQTRRTISVSKNSYVKLKDYAAVNSVSMSSLVEKMIKKLPTAKELPKSLTDHDVGVMDSSLQDFKLISQGLEPVVTKAPAVLTAKDIFTF